MKKIIPIILALCAFCLSLSNDDGRSACLSQTTTAVYVGPKPLQPATPPLAQGTVTVSTTGTPQWSVSGAYSLKHRNWSACAFYKVQALKTWPKLGEIDLDGFAGATLSGSTEPVVGSAVMFWVSRGNWSAGVGPDVLLQQGKILDGGFGASISVRF